MGAKGGYNECLGCWFWDRLTFFLDRKGWRLMKLSLEGPWILALLTRLWWMFRGNFLDLWHLHCSNMFRLKGPHIWWYFVVQVSIFGGKAEVLISQKPPPGWMFEIPKCHRPTDHVSVFLVHNMVDVMHYIIGIKSLYPHVLHDIIYMYIYMEQLHPWPIYSQLAVVCLYTLHDVWCRIYLSVVPQRHRLFESKSRVPENWRPLRKGELTQIKVLRNGEDIEHKVWEFIGKIHTQWIPTGPLYKVYMGLIIKGTIPRVPPFSLWGILDVSLGGEKPETCSV